ALPVRALVVQLASVALLVANLFAVRSLARAHYTTPGAPHALPAVILTAAYFPLVHWSVMGMETALQALLITAAVKLTLDIAWGRARRFTALSAVAATALSLRLDMALGLCACAAYLWPALRRSRAREWLPGAALVAAAVLGYEAFRLAYFGDPLPNTYYLKLTGSPVGPRAAHGLAMWLEFARPIAPPLVAVPGGAPWLGPTHPPVLPPPANVPLPPLYSLYVGGHRYHYYAAANRFVAPFVPLLFVAGTGLLNEALARAPERWRPSGRARTHALAGLCVAALLASNGLLEVQVRRQWLAYLGIDRPLFVDKHPK